MPPVVSSAAGTCGQKQLAEANNCTKSNPLPCSGATSWKMLIEKMKVTYKACLQKKNKLSLHSWYAEAQQARAHILNSQKCYFGGISNMNRKLTRWCSAKSCSKRCVARPGLPDLLFAKGPNLVQKEPKNSKILRQRANHFFQIYQHLQSPMKPYLVTY